MRVVLIVGARPNFMKAAPVAAALARRGVDVKLIHTGQHFDRAMSDVFFEVLNLPRPDVYLGIERGSRGHQFGEIVSRLSELLPEMAVDRVLVFGDVTSTAAGAVAADACDIPVDHVEAGLRSFDWTMPEERNRRVADTLSHLLYASEQSGVDNLLREGHARERIHLTGNVMIDTLERNRVPAEAARPWKAFGVERDHYALVTVHRPGNVDTAENLARVHAMLTLVARRMPVIFPVHPRTRQRFETHGLAVNGLDNLHLCEPQDYVTFLGLMAGAGAIITDSGGMQEESTVLGVPCLVLRPNTERPATLVTNGGGCTLTGLDAAKIEHEIERIADGTYPRGKRPELWDGRAADRIADILIG